MSAQWFDHDFLGVMDLVNNKPVFRSSGGHHHDIHSTAGAVSSVRIDTPVIVAETVVFSYLLAITVFLLDIIYALVDPRVKIGGEGSRT